MVDVDQLPSYSEALKMSAPVNIQLNVANSHLQHEGEHTSRLGTKNEFYDAFACTAIFSWVCLALFLCRGNTLAYKYGSAAGFSFNLFAIFVVLGFYEDIAYNIFVFGFGGGIGLFYSLRFIKLYRCAVNMWPVFTEEQKIRWLMMEQGDIV